MSTLIPQVSIIDFKRLSNDQILRLKSCEIFSDGDYLFTFIRPQTDFIRTQSEYHAQLSNSVGGKDLSQIVDDMSDRELYISDKPPKKKIKHRRRK